MTDQPHAQPGLPTHEAFWPGSLFADGIGWVIIARSKAGGRRTETGIFLIDVFCLGAKLAVYEDTDTGDYRRRIRDHYMKHFPMVEASPACARKLIQKAVAYASGLGFAPHPDYRQAARVFGGLMAAQCLEEFAFGCQGKPFYRRGPRETEAEARRIIEHLHRRCGPGNFDYMVMLGNAEDITRAYEV